MKQFSKITVILALLFVVDLGSSQGIKARQRGGADDEDDSSASNSASTETLPDPVRESAASNKVADRPKRYEGINANGGSNQNSDRSPSAQNINPSITTNPYLLNNQAGLLNNPSLYQSTGALGLGLAGQNQIQNPYLSGIGQYQNPYAQAALQQQLLLGQQGGGQFGQFSQLGGQLGQFGQLGGLGGGIYNQDIYSGGAGGYNPYLGLNGGGNFGLAGGLGGGLGGLGGGGIGGLGGLGGQNPYLLGRSGYLGGQVGAGNYLAQSLLSPYNSFNPYNQYPFSSRFGIGRSSTRVNSATSSSNSNNDE